MSFQIRYQFERGDYVALAVALAKPSLGKRLANVVIDAVALVSIFVAIVLYQGVALTELRSTMTPELFGGYMPNWFPPLMIVLVATVAWKHWVGGLVAFFHYRGLAFANQPYALDLTEAGVDISAPGVTSHLDWARILRIIETRNHLFLKIDKRQAVGLPRRAFADDAAYQSALAYIKTKTKPGTPHDIR